MSRQNKGLAAGRVGVADAAQHRVAVVGLPVIAVDDGRRLTLLYVRRKAASQPGLAYAIEFSGTLAAGSWAVNPSATETATSIEDTLERVPGPDSTPLTGPRFVRLAVEHP